MLLRAGRGAGAVLVSAALGFVAAQVTAERALPWAALPSRAVTLTGTVQAIDLLPAGRRVLFGAPVLDDAAPLARGLRVRLRGDDPAAIETGDSVRVRALLRPPAPPAYPGAWDLQRDAWFSGLGGYGFALGAAETLKHGPAGGLRRLREELAGRIVAVLPGAPGAIAATLLTGMNSAIPPADRAGFRDSGLAHLLAIAGLHIGIVMGLIMGLTRLLLACWERAALHWPVKQIAALAALAGGGGYALLTGVHVPILRSFAMAALVTLGLLAGRRAISLRGLGLAAAALILIEPEQITGVSFQMSFSAVLALIAGYEVLRPRLRSLFGDGRLGRRLLSYGAALALTSLLAATASAPFAAYHFGQIQLYSVLANLLAVPLTALWVMPAGLLSLALMPVHLEFLALQPMGWGVQAVLWIGRTVSSWPVATLAVPHPPDWGLALVALGMAWLGLWRSGWRLAGVPVIALGLLSAWLVRPPDLLVSSDARVIGLRSGQGLFLQLAPGASHFTEDAFERYWAGTARPLQSAPPEAVSCTQADCLLRARPGGPAALLLRGETPGRCGQAVVLIAAEPVHVGCPGLPTIDRFTVWRSGPQAIWLNPEVRILSDRAERGDRPWILGASERRSSAVVLPMAQQLPLPPE